MKKAQLKVKYFTLIYVVAIVNFPLVSRSQACDKVKISDFPVKDLPIGSDKEKLKEGKSYIYYYGIGVDIDYVKARYIAFRDVERNEGERTIVDGYSILMMLYANGFGVE